MAQGWCYHGANALDIEWVPVPTCPHTWNETFPSPDLGFLIKEGTEQDLGSQAQNSFFARRCVQNGCDKQREGCLVWRQLGDLHLGPKEH
jgi:hypothetical protein